MGNSSDNVRIMLGDPRKAVLSMFLPMFFALLIGQINAFVDAVWCSGLGVDVMSAISLCSSIYFILVGIGNGIGIGANVAISRRIGAGDIDGATKCASQTIIAMLIISLPLVPILYFSIEPLMYAMGGGDIMSECKAYLTPMILFCPFTIVSGVIAGTLRGEGAANISTKIQVSAAVCNMVLDPVLIFVLGLGIMGASMATAISAILAVALGIAIYLSGRAFLKPKPCRPEREILYDVFYVGMPQTAELIIMGAMNLILVTLVVACGGTVGLAIYGVPWNFMTLAMVPVHALAASMVPVCSSAIGQKDRSRLRSGYYFTVRTAFIAAFLLSSLIAIFADYCMGIFTYSSSMTEYHADLVHVVRIYSCFLPFYGLIFVGSSMLSCLRKSPYALLSSFLRNVLLISIYVIAISHTMEWIYWGLTVGEVIGGIGMIALAQWQYQIKYRDMGPKNAAI